MDHHPLVRDDQGIDWPVFRIVRVHHAVLFYPENEELTADELDLLTHIAHLTLEDPDSPLTAGMLFDSAQMQMRLSYTNFHQRIKKFDDLRLINVNHKNRGIGGKTREIMLRYDPVKVMKVGYKISS